MPLGGKKIRSHGTPPGSDIPILWNYGETR